MKAQRQRAIVEVVEREAIWSQDLLGQRLRARGFDVTQATLSRDIKELGLVKRASDGAYQRPGQAVNGATAEATVAALRRACRETLRSFEQVQHMLVL
jgi:transcriptional regulator of arginine metabolism